MPEGHPLADLVGRFYDAALDPALWPEALATGAAYIGGQSAGFLAKDTLNQICAIYHPIGFDPDYVRLYTDEYWKIDPLAPLPFFPAEGPTSIKDYMSHDDLREGRFYREWLAPQGWVDAVSVMIERSSTSCTMLVVVRNEASGVVDDDMTERMGLIAPHIRRAALIGRVSDAGQGDAAAFAEILDGLSAGVFLVDADARIVHANVAGRAILAAEDFLQATRDRLVARPAAVDRALRAAFLAAAKGNAAAGAGAISLPLIARDYRRYIAHVLPLASETGRRGGIAGAAVAAVFVHGAAIGTPSLPESIARHYQLTPSELRVLLAVVEVGGGPEVAEALGVGAGTVKTHLKHLFEKTGTGRQVDLVKLVAGFSRPLLS